MNCKVLYKEQLDTCQFQSHCQLLCFQFCEKQSLRKGFKKSLLVFPKDPGEEGGLGSQLTCLLYILRNSSLWKMTIFISLKGQKDLGLRS